MVEMNEMLSISPSAICGLLEKKKGWDNYGMQ